MVPMGAFVMPALMMPVHLASCVVIPATREDRSKRVSCCAVRRAAAGVPTAAMGTASCKAQDSCKCWQEQQLCPTAACHGQQRQATVTSGCLSDKCRSLQLVPTLARFPPASWICLPSSCPAQQARALLRPSPAPPPTPGRTAGRGRGRPHGPAAPGRG